MLVIIHKVNKIEELKKTPKKYGVEVDIRSVREKLILNHEPFKNGDSFEEYLKHFNHAFIILDIKEEGIEAEVIRLCRKYNVKKYFLLGVSFPYTYLLTQRNITKFAVRFSEFESVDTCLSMKGKIDWVWVDTFENNPLKKREYKKLKNSGFKLCFVCPERWSREKDIKKYRVYFQKNEIFLDAVMTGQEYIHQWT